MSREGPCEVFTASGCLTVGATEVGLGADGGTGFPAGWTKRGHGTRKNSAKARGCGRVHFSVWKSRKAGGGTGVGPPGKHPGKCPVGPGSPARAAGGVAGWYALTTEVVTAEPRLGHTQGEGRGV